MHGAKSKAVLPSLLMQCVLPKQQHVSRIKLCTEESPFFFESPSGMLLSVIRPQHRISSLFVGGSLFPLRYLHNMETQQQSFIVKALQNFKGKTKEELSFKKGKQLQTHAHLIEITLILLPFLCFLR